MWPIRMYQNAMAINAIKCIAANVLSFINNQNFLFASASCLAQTLPEKPAPTIKNRNLVWSYCDCLFDSMRLLSILPMILLFGNVKNRFTLARA